jgi:PAS domain S-box-containing protein
MNWGPSIFPNASVIFFFVFSVAETSVQPEAFAQFFPLSCSFDVLSVPCHLADFSGGFIHRIAQTSVHSARIAFSEGIAWGWVVIVSVIILPSWGLTFLFYRRWRENSRCMDLHPGSEIGYQDIFENPFAPMLIVNPNDGRIIDANQVALNFYGYSKKEMLNFHIWDINILSQQQMEVDMAKAKNERRNTFRFRHRLKSGEIKDVEVFSGPIMFKGEKLLFSTIRDISNVLQWEKGLVEAKLEAETASRAKDDLLSVISHEMRTPLNPIIGFSTLLMGELKDPEPIRQLEIINESAERLKQLINDVLQFSKLTAGAYELAEHPFDLGRMLQSIASMFNQDTGRNELLIENGTGEHMSPFRDGTQLLGDTGVLHHVISNLVGNACKYTTRGRIVIRYGVLEENEKKCRICIEVQENGIGIADELRERIFEPFNPAETSFSRSFEGVGLGLAICRRLVAILDGELNLESEIGKGSRFWINLWLNKLGSVNEFSEK